MTHRVLVVQEVNDYEVPMFPRETPEHALTRYLEDGPDNFYARTHERESWVEIDGDREKDIPGVQAWEHKEEVTP